MHKTNNTPMTNLPIESSSQWSDEDYGVRIAFLETEASQQAITLFCGGAMLCVAEAENLFQTRF